MRKAGRGWGWLVALATASCGSSEDHSDLFTPQRDESASSTGSSSSGSSSDETTGGKGGEGSGGQGGEGGGKGTGDDAGGITCKNADEWMLGKAYETGAVVRGKCVNPGGAPFTCIAEK